MRLCGRTPWGLVAVLIDPCQVGLHKLPLYNTAPSVFKTLSAIVAPDSSSTRAKSVKLYAVQNLGTAQSWRPAQISVTRLQRQGLENGTTQLSAVTTALQLLRCLYCEHGVPPGVPSKRFTQSRVPGWSNHSQ